MAHFLFLVLFLVLVLSYNIVSRKLVGPPFNAFDGLCCCVSWAGSAL